MLLNILRGMAAKILVAGINFFILIISSRYLGAASRGEISLYLLNIALVQLINEVYTGYGLILFIPRYNLRTILLKGLIITALVCPLIYGLFVLFNTNVDGYTGVGIFTTVMVVMNTFNCVLLLGHEKIRTYNLLSLIQPSLLLAGMCVSIFACEDLTFRAFVWPLLFSFLISLTISLFMISKLPFGGKSAELPVPKVLLNGLMYQGAIILLLLTNRFSYYLFNSNHDIGVYSAASSIMDAALVLGASIAPVLISRVANRGDLRESAYLSLALSKLSVILTVVCVFLVLILPNSFFVRVLGNDFAELRLVMLWYAPGAVLLSFFMILSAFFSASGKQKIVFYAYGAGCICTLITSPFTVKYLGVTGAALTANFSYLMITIILLRRFLIHNGFESRDLFAWKEDLKKMKGAMGSFVRLSEKS